jgi:hypothetical protein
VSRSNMGPELIPVLLTMLHQVYKLSDGTGKV